VDECKPLMLGGPNFNDEEFDEKYCKDKAGPVHLFSLSSLSSLSALSAPSSLSSLASLSSLLSLFSLLTVLSLPSLLTLPTLLHPSLLTLLSCPLSLLTSLSFTVKLKLIYLVPDTA